VAAFKVGEIQVVCRVGQVLVLGIRDVIAHSANIRICVRLTFSPRAESSKF
jgi:hypothetical protein